MAEDDNKRNKGIKMMINSFNKYESLMINFGFYYTGADRPRFNDFMFWPILERIEIWWKKCNGEELLPDNDDGVFEEVL